MREKESRASFQRALHSYHRSSVKDFDCFDTCKDLRMVLTHDDEFRGLVGVKLSDLFESTKSDNWVVDFNPQSAHDPIFCAHDPIFCAHESIFCAHESNRR